MAQAGREDLDRHGARGPARGRVLALLLLLAAPPTAGAADPADGDLERVVADYTRLYAKDTLPQWRQLFLPQFVSGHVNEEDGSVTQRSLDQFYAAQKRYLESGRAIKEELRDLRIERRGRLASVSAEFVLTEDGVASRGWLILTLIQDRGAFKIHSLLFSYLP